jgi:hypothetical protein
MCINHEGVHWHEQGQASFTGDALALYHALDAAILKLASQWQPQACQFGTFISAQDLQKMDYLHSFPQHATFALTLAQDDENLRNFSRNEQFNPDGTIKLTHLAPAAALLTPAACYHIYIHLQNSQLSRAGYFTTANQCFRRESHYKPLERQWGFRMREVVCVGSSDDVAAFLQAARQSTEQWINALDLPIQWETATDPFFDPANSTKHLLQKIQPNKTEMIFDNRLAIGSLNAHRNYFGEIFNIQVMEAPAHSACLAFGIERWMAAVLQTFGINSKKWPLMLRQELV